MAEAISVPTQFDFKELLSHTFPGFFSALSLFMLLDLLSPIDLTTLVIKDLTTLISFLGLMIIIGTIIGVVLDGINHNFIQDDIFNNFKSIQEIELPLAKKLGIICSNSLTRHYYFPYLGKSDEGTQAIALIEHLEKGYYRYSEFYANIFISLILFSFIIPFYAFNVLQIDWIVSSYIGILSFLTGCVCFNSSYSAYKGYLRARNSAICGFISRPGSTTSSLSIKVGSSSSPSNSSNVRCNPPIDCRPKCPIQPIPTKKVNNYEIALNVLIVIVSFCVLNIFLNKFYIGSIFNIWFSIFFIILIFLAVMLSQGMPQYIGAEDIQNLSSRSQIAAADPAAELPSNQNIKKSIKNSIDSKKFFLSKDAYEITIILLLTSLFTFVMLAVNYDPGILLDKKQINLSLANLDSTNNAIKTLEIKSARSDVRYELEKTGLIKNWIKLYDDNGYIIKEISTNKNLINYIKLDINIPRNAPSGIYQGSIDIRNKSKDISRQIPVIISVKENSTYEEKFVNDPNLTVSPKSIRINSTNKDLPISIIKTINIKNIGPIKKVSLKPSDSIRTWSNLTDESYDGDINISSYVVSLNNKSPTLIGVKTTLPLDTAIGDYEGFISINDTSKATEPIYQIPYYIQIIKSSSEDC